MEGGGGNKQGPPLSMREWSRASRMRLHNPGTSNFDLRPFLQPFSPKQQLQSTRLSKFSSSICERLFICTV